MDDYDLQHTNKYKNVINFYCGDLKWNTKTGIIIDENNAIDTIKKTVTTNDSDFYERVLLTIYKLKNGLDILDTRQITNIGARIHCNNVDNYSEEKIQGMYKNYFDKVLPFAIVFDVADRWKDKLKDQLWKNGAMYIDARFDGEIIVKKRGAYVPHLTQTMDSTKAKTIAATIR